MHGPSPSLDMSHKKSIYLHTSFQNRQVDLANVYRIGDHVDLGELVMRDRDLAELW